MEKSSALALEQESQQHEMDMEPDEHGLYGQLNLFDMVVAAAGKEKRMTENTALSVIRDPIQHHMQVDRAIHEASDRARA